MKVAVLGAGVIGVTTAYFLSKAGHNVVVIDRQPESAAETSFANGGQLCTSLATPWAQPGIVQKIFSDMGDDNSPFSISLQKNPRQWLFGLGFLRRCSSIHYIDNLAKSIRLGAYSRSVFQDLTHDLKLSFDYAQNGILSIHDDPVEFRHAARTAETLNRLGTRIEVLDAAETLAREPKLANAGTPLVGSLYAPEDGHGDAQKFTTELTKVCIQNGVKFEFGQDIQDISFEDYRLYGVQTSKGMIEADAFVVALGSHSAPFLRRCGIGAPIYPLKGYSISIALSDSEQDIAPTCSLTHEGHRIVVSKLGRTLRVAGIGEFSDWDNSTIRPEKLQSVLSATASLFPEILSPETSPEASKNNPKVTPWVGLRPMTPDCLPILGETRAANVYVNSGHGSYGWSMACGSAKLVADQINDTDTALPMSDYGVDRFGPLLRI